MPDAAVPAVGSVVAVGGGSGLAVLLRGLKEHVGSNRLGALTAVVTMADDGGSSGRLRRDFGVLPPGDVRSCIVALADDEDLLAKLFDFRFENGEGLEGHSFGNLLLTALTGITGDFYQAVLTAESILSVRGKILPATLADVRLAACGVSGRCYEGESAIGAAGERLAEVEILPGDAPAFAPAAAAIRGADLVVLGPGSLYTSILPNLLIRGIREALRETRAPVVLLMNLMTQPGETDGLDGAGHLAALEHHAGPGLVDCLLVSSTPLPEELCARYRRAGAEPVDTTGLEACGPEVVRSDLLAADTYLRHDPAKLSAAVLALARRSRPAARPRPAWS